MNKKYDVLYINGKIFTSDDNCPYANAMAVKDGKIAWIGNLGDLNITEDEYDKKIDLKGQRILPGFVDSHMHAIMLSECCKQISVLPPAIYSIEELVAEVKKVREAQGPDKWVRGWGYDEGKLSEHRAPTRYDLDKGCSDSPVLILRTCGHVGAVNSKTLEIVGITADTPDPPGGKIGRDENGIPNGILYENARALVTDIMEKPTMEDDAQNLKELGDLLISQGVTTAADMGEFMEYDYRDVYKKAIAKGYKVRTAGYYMWDGIADKEHFDITPEDQDPSNLFRAAGIKLIGDGSVSGRTAWCDEPYLGGNGDEYGIPVCTDKDIDDAVKFCKAHKCQLSIHSMGARTIDRALEHVWQEKSWVEGDVPFVRLEHVAMPTKEAIKRAAASGIAFVTQPIFLYAEIESYLKNMGAERTKENYPISDWIKEGVRFSFSTDAPATSWAEPSNPFVCLKGAVTRRAWDGTDCGQRHKVDVETAIKLYTAASAPMLGFTDVGMLKAGYAADFIALDRDIMEISADEIDKVQVTETFIAGESVYKR